MSRNGRAFKLIEDQDFKRRMRKIRREVHDRLMSERKPLFMTFRELVAAYVRSHENDSWTEWQMKPTEEIRKML